MSLAQLLKNLGVTFNFVRNDRVDILCGKHEKDAVFQALKQHQYIVTDCDYVHGAFQIRAV